MKLNKETVGSFLVVLFHLVGFFGFVSPCSDLFKQLVPFHLLLMFALLVISHPDRNRNFWFFLGAIFLSGYLVELLGVHTDAIFGEYFYKTTLGVKLAEVPLLIGINWVLVIYSAGALLEESGIKNRLVKSLLAAVLVTLLDFFIEPIAIRFDYWEWTDVTVPIQNYIGWFVVSFLMLLLFNKLRFDKENRLGTVLFITQLCFFIGLNLQVN